MSSDRARTRIPRILPLLNGVFLGYVDGGQWAGIFKGPIDISTLERFERFEV